MTKISLTDNEITVLDHIARNCYQPTNYGRPETFEDTSSIWSHSITDSGSKRPAPKGKALSGTVGSLAAKGLVWTTADGRDSTVGLTEAGFNAWKNSDAYAEEGRR